MAVVNQYKFVGIDNDTSDGELNPFGSGNPLATETYIIKSILEYEGPIDTPINKGDKLGVLKVYLSDELIKEIDILAAENVKRSNIFVRLFTSLNYLVWGDV